MKIPRVWQFLFSLLVCFAAGGIGQLFTYKEITTWYAHVQKASFTPPNWVFGPVWTLLYTLMAVSLFLALGKRGGRLKKWGITCFFTQLLLNTLWSLLFFGAHATFLAFIEILFMIVFTILTVIFFWKISRIAAFLLLPYIFWISFASLLNLFVVILNR